MGKTICFKVDKDLHNAVKKRLQDNGMTLKNHVLKLIAKDLGKYESNFADGKTENIEQVVTLEQIKAKMNEICSIIGSL